MSVGERGPTPGTAPPASNEPGGVRPSFLVDPPEFRWPSLRPVLGVLALFILVGGIAYPLMVDGVERATGAFDPTGAFDRSGDPRALAAYALGQNITNDSLFWLRPSLTDFQLLNFTGETPYGPTDPQLRNLTDHYIELYGLNNTSVPIDLVGNSGSGIDAALTPAAVLVQIPRVSAHTHFTEPFLTEFVMDHVTEPLGGLVGPEYVNVLILDADLIEKIRASGTA